MQRILDLQSNDGLPALKVYSQLQQEGLLPIRVQLTINHSDIDTASSSTAAATDGDRKHNISSSSSGSSSNRSSDAQQLHALLSSVRKHNSSSSKADVLLTCDRVKVFADGSLGAETAAVREPYTGTSNTGVLIHTQEELCRQVANAHAQGFR
jgi:predicted amidohydrolase YtcJ